MRKPIAITFKDVRPGDVVCEQIGESYEIERVEERGGPIYNTMHLYIKGGGLGNLFGHPDQIIGLLYRPYPEGKTEMDVFDTVLHAFWAIVQGADWSEAPHLFLVFQEAIEAWELGLPAQAGKPLN